MDSSRRDMLSKVGALTSVSVCVGVSGCMDVVDQVNTNGAEDGDGEEIGELSIPNPVVDSLSTPDVEIVDVFRETIDENSGDDELFTAEIENTGSEGSVIIELYWVPEQESGSGFGMPEGELEFHEHEEIFVEEDENSNVSIQATMSDGYDGFWFVVSSVTVSIDVINNGSDGRVEIQLKDNGDVVDSTVITIQEGELKTVGLRGNDVQESGDFDVSVSAVE